MENNNFPVTDLKEMETCELPEKRILTIIFKKLKGQENTERQVKELRKIMCEQNEMFSRDINDFFKMLNRNYRTKEHNEYHETWQRELQQQAQSNRRKESLRTWIQISQQYTAKKKELRVKKENWHKLWHTIKENYISVIGVPEEEERKEMKTYLKE